MHETELKFRVDGFDAIEPLYSFCEAQHITDTYYVVPGRDQRNSDEWLRLRAVCPVNEEHPPAQYYLTYKGSACSTRGHHAGLATPEFANQFPGPTREEIEVACDNQAPSLMSRLNLSRICCVSKMRRVAAIPLNYNVSDFATIALDDVRDLGKFVELEIVSNDWEYLDLAVQLP